MDSTELIGNWYLNLAPLNCRSTVLNEVKINFATTGCAFIYDPISGTSGGNYTVILNNHSETCLSGTIVINCGGWTQAVRLWDTTDEETEAERSSDFIRELVANPIVFKLETNILTVYHKDAEYEFIRETY